MRIAPRTMLCATDWQAREVQESRGRFAELRELCSAAGDKVSLAIGMSGLATELMYAGRAREASRLSSEQMALLESIGDPTPTMGLASIAFCNWLGVGEFGEILRWSQTIVDLAAGDPAKGAGYGVGSPLAIALAWRGTARWWLGRPGWRQDLHDAVAMARRQQPGNPLRCRRLDLRFRDAVRGASGRRLRWCAPARMRCRPPKEPAAIAHWAWPRTRWLSGC